MFVQDRIYLRIQSLAGNEVKDQEDDSMTSGFSTCVSLGFNFGLWEDCDAILLNLKLDRGLGIYKHNVSR